MKRIDIILLFFSALFFLLLRNINLKGVPIYLDEAVYINWSNILNTDQNLAYISMQDGKTPLYFWITSKFLNLFNDPLRSARFISVAAGLGTLFSAWILTTMIFGKKTGYFFLFLYPLSPFAHFIERMAFADSLFVFFGTFCLDLTFFSFKLKERKSTYLLTKIILGLTTGFFLFLAFLTKSSARLYFLPLLIILIFESSEKIKKFNLLKLISFFLFILAIYLTYSELLNAFSIATSRFFMNIATKEKLLTFSVNEFISHPLRPEYTKNLPIFTSYLLSYITIPSLLVIFYSIAVILKRRKKNEIIILLVTIIIFSEIYFSSKILASRYFLPMIPFLISIESFGIYSLMEKLKKKLFVVILILVFVPLLYVNLEFSLIPNRAPFASQDKNYLFGFNLSGVGVEEIINYLNRTLEKDDVTLAVDSFWGQPDYIEMKIKSKKPQHQFSLKKCSYFAHISGELKESSKSSRVFLLSLSGYSPNIYQESMKSVEEIEKVTLKSSNRVIFYEMLK